MPQHSHPDSAERARATPSDVQQLAAVRSAVANGYALIAVLGRTSGESTTYLAREDVTGDLVAVTADLSADASASDGLSFVVSRRLEPFLPGPSSVCPSCGHQVDGWSRYCNCGRDLSGVSPTSDDDRLELAERVRQATAGEYEILGSIQYADDAGYAWFGRQHDAGEIVALRVHADGEFSDGTTRYSLAATQPLAVLDANGRSPLSGPVHLTPAHAFNVIPDEQRRDRPSDPDQARVDDHHFLMRSGLGSGLMAKVPTPLPAEQVAVPKVCPQCGIEYETGSRFCPNDGSPLRPKGTTDPLVGRVLADRYHVLKKLGEGGMGKVYLGEHVKMNRQCAIKVMSAQLVNDSESAMRFAREASSAARIIHPNVAAVFDYGESDGLVYIVMEYIDGEPLSRILETEPVIAPYRALDIARQVADGLSAAHELGIVHRDLKPDNIILSHTRSGREVAKIVDFGIAKAAQDGPQEALTRTGLVIGTPEFMSPEQLLGDPVDARSDLYSLGCILYQMLTGTPTFDASTREQMITRRLTEEPPHVRRLIPELPEACDSAVYKLLARTPGMRTSTAAEAREMLTPIALLGEHWDPEYRPTPRSMPTIVMGAVGTTEKLQIIGGVSIGGRRRRLRTGIAVAAGAVVLGASVAVAALRNSRDPESGAPQVAAASIDSAKRADSTLRADSIANAAKAAAAASKTTQPAPGLAGTPTPRVPAKPGPTRAQRDSIRAASRPHVVEPVDTLEQALRKPIETFASEWARGDSASLIAYTGIGDSTVKNWRKTLENVEVKSVEVLLPLKYAIDPTKSLDTVTVKLRLLLHLKQRGAATPPTVVTPDFEAVVARASNGWLINRIWTTKTPE